MRLRTIVAALVATVAASAAQAQQKIQIGCTATGDCASAMVAIDEGIFKRLGLEAEMVLIGLNSNIPAALISNSIQIGGPTSSVFLQAVDGGLDLVGVAGASSINERTSNLVAVVGRTGVNFKEPKDFVGKKVGAPGLGAFLHVLFVKWLMDKGVDPKAVNFVEVSFPTMNDILKSGAVDAVLAGEPFISRFAQAGTGTAAFRYLQDLNRTEPVIFYAASRDWAQKNAEAVKKFREGIIEAAKIVNADRDKAAASVSKFSKQPLELLKSFPLSFSNPELKTSDLNWWIDVMKQQKLMQNNVDVAKLLLN